MQETRPGPPQRIAGLTVGLVEMSEDAPHGVEVHPDGNEVLMVLSGRIRVCGENTDADLVPGPGQACIIPRGEWHRIRILAPTRRMLVTPGPNGDHRPPA